VTRLAVLGRNVWTPKCLLSLSFLTLTLVLSPPLGAISPSAGGSGGVKDNWSRAYSSWALGIVVPDGAKLEGGGVVSWRAETNITALVHLPNVTRPDGITYIVLSAMGNDRTVFQVAVGIWPSSSLWSVYSWFITGVDSQSPTYKWVANGTGQQMSPSDLLSISIFLGPSAWLYGVADYNTSGFWEGFFPGASARSFDSGDQEVVSLESYSRSTSTFHDMGNLTLESLYVDGERILGGWYSYSGWDPQHNPLFTVGGSAAPLFISFASNARGGAVWSYSPEWTGGRADPFTAPIAAGVIATVLAVCVYLALRRNPKKARMARTG
jgi:hypothetical protein